MRRTRLRGRLRRKLRRLRLRQRRRFGRRLRRGWGRRLERRRWGRGSRLGGGCGWGWGGGQWGVGGWGGAWGGGGWGLSCGSRGGGGDWTHCIDPTELQTCTGEAQREELPPDTAGEQQVLQALPLSQHALPLPLHVIQLLRQLLLLPQPLQSCHHHQRRQKTQTNEKMFVICLSYLNRSHINHKK